MRPKSPASAGTATMYFYPEFADFGFQFLMNFNAIANRDERNHIEMDARLCKK